MWKAGRRSRRLRGVTEPFIDYVRARVVSADASQAVVEQPADEELANHVGVRHASALNAAAYEASRALVAEAAGPGAAVRLVESEIAYKAVAIGPIVTTAEFESRDELVVLATSRNEKGKTVVTLKSRWTA